MAGSPVSGLPAIPRSRVRPARTGSGRTRERPAGQSWRSDNQQRPSRLSAAVQVSRRFGTDYRGEATDDPSFPREPIPMTMIYDPPTYTDSGQTPPGSPWHGPAGPGGPAGPYGYGGGGDGRHPVRRWRHRFALATVAVVAGLGSFFAVLAATAPSRSVVLTTAQIAAQTDPGLVDIVSNLGLQQAESAGTGLVLTPSGEILTNNHVIKGATAIRVTDIGNGHTYPAKVVGYDQSRDIAVIQLVGASGLQTAALGNSSTAQVGNKVVALGNAGGKGGTPSVAGGRVAGLNASIMASDEGAGTVERLTGLIHHTAPIQPGDSGGP